VKDRGKEVLERNKAIQWQRQREDVEDGVISFPKSGNNYKDVNARARRKIKVLVQIVLFFGTSRARSRCKKCQKESSGNILATASKSRRAALN
jgi:hypothetical protein